MTLVVGKVKPTLRAVSGLNLYQTDPFGILLFTFIQKVGVCFPFLLVSFSDFSAEFLVRLILEK